MTYLCRKATLRTLVPACAAGAVVEVLVHETCLGHSGKDLIHAAARACPKAAAKECFGLMGAQTDE